MLFSQDLPRGLQLALGRLEVAAPFNPEPGGAKWELRLSHSDRTTFFWREPVDVDAARARVVPASVYSWP